MGGITTLVLYGLVTVALIPFGVLREGTCAFFCFPYWSLPSILGSEFFFYPINLIFGLNTWNTGFFGRGIETFIFASIFYLAVGVVAGWIYGKIKSQKSVSPSNI